MKYKLLLITVMCAILGACTSYIETSQQRTMLGAPLDVDSKDEDFAQVNEIGTGLYVPNDQGGVYLIKGADRKAPNPDLEEAYELKLKARELAAQLLDTRNNSILRGIMAVPTTFVNLDDFNVSSQLGRYLSEAMFHEFNQRDFPIREYRLNSRIDLTPNVGELLLTRSLPNLPYNQKWAAVLVGTYQKNNAAVYVNARLVRPSDGAVLRTGQIVIPMNKLITNMSKQPLFKTVGTKLVR